MLSKKSKRYTSQRNHVHHMQKATGFGLEAVLFAYVY